MIMEEERSLPSVKHTGVQREEGHRQKKKHVKETTSDNMLQIHDSLKRRVSGFSRVSMLHSSAKNCF